MMAQHFTVGGYPNPDPHYISPEEEAQEYARLDDDHTDAYGFIDDDRTYLVIPLQYGFWGFRINGSALHSYPTKAQAEEAFYRLISK